MERTEKLAVLLEKLDVAELKICDLDVITTSKSFSMDREYVLNNIGINRLYLKNMTIDTDSVYYEYTYLEKPNANYIKLAEVILNTYNSLNCKSAIFNIVDLKVVDVKVNH